MPDTAFSTLTENGPDLAARYLDTRAFTESIVRPLTAEDCQIQSITETRYMNPQAIGT